MGSSSPQLYRLISSLSESMVAHAAVANTITDPGTSEPTTTLAATMMPPTIAVTPNASSTGIGPDCLLGGTGRRTRETAGVTSAANSFRTQAGHFQPVAAP